MKIKKTIQLFGILVAVVAPVFLFVATRVFAATTTVDLLTADNFAILAYSAVTDTTPSTIVGDVGLTPTSGTFITGLTSAQVTGTIYAVDAGGPGGSVSNPGLLTQAKNDLDTAYLDAAGRTPATVLPGSDNQLGGQVLTEGVYSFGAASSANIVGTVTLDAEGDANAVFIFQASSSLITGSASVVNLINGAQACNVFWQVASSATLGTGSDFSGNILAHVSITDNGGSTVNGRLMARTAAVTTNNTTLTIDTCDTSPTPTPSPTATPSASLSSSASVSSDSSSGGSSTAGPCVASEITTTPIILEARRSSPTSVFISWGPFAGEDQFNIRYGFANGDWLYNADVTGFSTTLNDLPAHKPIWVQVATRNDCAIGTYGDSKLVGNANPASNPLIPRLPNTGFGPTHASLPWFIAIPTSIVMVASATLAFILKKREL